MDILFYSFLILNGIAFSLMGYDKYLAKAKKIRIPDQILLVFFGGTVGSGLAMLVYKHKTSKIAYLWKFWRIVFIQF